LDEVFLRINGAPHYLSRAVDQHGVVLDILVLDRRNAAAAKRFFKRLRAELRYKPRHIPTNSLCSYGAARREVLPEVRHRTSRYLNNRAENSHRPTRRREHQMLPCVSASHAPGPHSRSMARSVRAVVIADAEWDGCPLRMIRGSACHVETANSENQTVRLGARCRTLPGSSPYAAVSGYGAGGRHSP
jgi:hypothetical protein